MDNGTQNKIKVTMETGGKIESVLLPHLQFVLGRGTDSAIPLSDSNISRNHLQITLNESTHTIRIKDLNSSNGTFLNRQRVSPGIEYELKPNDQVKCGSCPILFSFESLVKSEESVIQEQPAVGMASQNENEGAAPIKPPPAQFENDSAREDDKEIIQKLLQQSEGHNNAAPSIALQKLEQKINDKNHSLELNFKNAELDIPKYKNPSEQAHAVIKEAEYIKKSMLRGAEVKSELIINEAEKKAIELTEIKLNEHKEQVRLLLEDTKLTIQKLRADYDVEVADKKLKLEQELTLHRKNFEQQLEIERKNLQDRITFEEKAKFTELTERLKNENLKERTELENKLKSEYENLKFKHEQEFKEKELELKERLQRIENQKLEELALFEKTKRDEVFEFEKSKREEIYNLEKCLRDELSIFEKEKRSELLNFETEKREEIKAFENKKRKEIFKLENDKRDEILQYESSKKVEVLEFERLKKEEIEKLENDKNVELQLLEIAKNDEINQLMIDTQEKLLKQRKEHDAAISQELNAHITKIDNLKKEISELIETKNQADETLADFRKNKALLESSIDRLNNEKDKLESEIKTSTDFLNQNSEKLIQCQHQLSETDSQHKSLLSDISDLEKKRADVKEQLNKLAESLSRSQREYDEIHIKIENSKKSGKAELEQEMKNLRQIEEQKLSEFKVQQTRLIQQVKENSLEQIAKISLDLSEEVLKKLEMSGFNKIENYNHDKTFELINSVLQVHSNAHGKVNTSHEEQVAEWRSKQKRDRAKTYAMAFVSYTFITVIGFFAYKKLQHDPIEEQKRQMASLREKAIEANKLTLEETDEYKSNYLDATFYTRRFSEVYLNAEVQQKWSDYMTKQFLKKWKIEEEKMIQVISSTRSLVQLFNEKKQTLTKDGFKGEYEKLRQLENEYIQKNSALLGSQVRFEDYKKFEQEFFKDKL